MHYNIINLHALLSKPINLYIAGRKVTNFVKANPYFKINSIFFRVMFFFFLVFFSSKKPCYNIAGYSNHEKTIFYQTGLRSFVELTNKKKQFYFRCVDLHKSHHDTQNFFKHLFSKLFLNLSEEEAELNLEYLICPSNPGKYTDTDELLALQIVFSTLTKSVLIFLNGYGEWTTLNHQ